MLRRISKRLLQSLFVKFGVVTIVIFVSRLSGDPVRLMLPPDATAEQEIALRGQLGLDQPLCLQYWNFLRRVATGDLGQSLRYNEDAITLFAERLPATPQLTLIAMLLAVCVGLL